MRASRITRGKRRLTICTDFVPRRPTARYWNIHLAGGCRGTFVSIGTAQTTRVAADLRGTDCPFDLPPVTRIAICPAISLNCPCATAIMKRRLRALAWPRLDTVPETSGGFQLGSSTEILGFPSNFDPVRWPRGLRRRFAKAATNQRTGLKLTISGPFFFGFVVGVGWRMTGFGRRLGTLLGTLRAMPMCA